MRVNYEVIGSTAKQSCPRIDFGDQTARMIETEETIGLQLYICGS